MENDLLENMEIRKQGNIKEKNCLGELEVNENITSNTHINNEHSCQIMRSASNNFNQSEFAKYSNNNLKGNTINEKIAKQSQNETSMISKNSLNIFSKNNGDFMLGKNNKINMEAQINVSTPRNTLENELKINPKELLSSDKNSLRMKKMKAKSSEIGIFDENDVKNYNLEKIELIQKSVYLEMEKEIELVRLKYAQKIMKLNYAADFLKKNPHLKNLREVDDYEKFSKSIEKSVILTKNHYDVSVGVNSVLPPHNPIKVNNYKPNNISHLNSKTEKKRGYVKTKQKNFSAS